MKTKAIFKGIPEIGTHRLWDCDRMRNFCIRYGYYSSGDCEDYESMLEFVMKEEPTQENMFYVAYDIVTHTSTLLEDTDFTLADHVAGLMFGIENEVVETVFHVQDFDNLYL